MEMLGHELKTHPQINQKRREFLRRPAGPKYSKDHWERTPVCPTIKSLEVLLNLGENPLFVFCSLLSRVRLRCWWLGEPWCCSILGPAFLCFQFEVLWALASGESGSFREQVLRPSNKNKLWNHLLRYKGHSTPEA